MPAIYLKKAANRFFSREIYLSCKKELTLTPKILVLFPNKVA